MKTFIGVLFFLTIGSQTGLAQAPGWLWAVQSGGPTHGNAMPESICTDNMGNIYVGVIFDSVVTIGDSTFHAARYNTQTLRSLFIVKYSPDGKILRIFHPEGALDNAFLALDSSGYLYLAVNVSPGYVLNFGKGLQSHTGASIVKIDSQGDALWVNQLSHDNSFGVSSLATDIYRGTYVSGNFAGIINIGGGSFNSDSLSGSLIIKVGNDGNVIWAKQPLVCTHNKITANYGELQINSLSLSGNTENIDIYISGLMYADSVFYGNNFIIGKGVSGPIPQPILARLDEQGNCLWAKSTDQQHDYYATGSAYSASVLGNFVYETGSYIVDSVNNSDTATPVVFDQAYRAFTYVAKYDVNGTLQWLGKVSYLRRHTEYGDILGSNICADVRGNCYLSGHFSGAVNFNGVIVNSIDSSFQLVGVRSEFVCKIDSSGKTIWVQFSGRSGLGAIVETTLSYEALLGNNVYVAGCFMEAPVSFGNSILSRNDSMYNERTLFLAKLGNTPSSVNSNPKSSENLFTLFPNPASTQAALNFTLAKSGNVTIEIYDLLGRRMKQVLLREIAAGEHSETLDLHGLSDGTYLCKMITGEDISSIMFTVIK